MNFWKTIACILIFALLVSGLWKWYNIYIVGGYFNNATIFLNMAMILLPIIGCFLAFHFIKTIIKTNF